MAWRGNNGVTPATLTISSGITIQGKAGSCRGLFPDHRLGNQQWHDQCQWRGRNHRCGSESRNLQQHWHAGSDGRRRADVRRAVEQYWGIFRDEFSVLNFWRCSFSLASLNLATFTRTGGTVNPDRGAEQFEPRHWQNAGLLDDVAPWNLVGGIDIGRDHYGCGGESAGADRLQRNTQMR